VITRKLQLSWARAALGRSYLTDRPLDDIVRAEEMNRTPGRQLGSVGAVALSFSRVTKRFGSPVALDDVSFHVRPGEIQLIGQNGFGKSTRMKLSRFAIQLLGASTEGSQVFYGGALLIAVSLVRLAPRKTASAEV
jgi:ATPase subunit of ABC transporter with duplicated ATPase domains